AMARRLPVCPSCLPSPGDPADAGSRPSSCRSVRVSKLLEILKTAHENDASDIHLVTGHPPMVRIHQVMTQLDFPVITPEESLAMLEQMASKEAIAKFEQIKDSD